MAEHLRAMGEAAHQCNDVRIKPILSRLNDFSQGRNTIHYHKEFGSRFHVQMIGLENHHPMDKSLLREGSEPYMCGSCQKCLKACPTQALTEEGFQREKCLRQHMMRGTPIPAHLRSLMGSRLVGCDICQQVCPYNTGLHEGPETISSFPLEPFLAGDPAAIKALSQAIGKNLAIPNRVCAQACIAAGNSGNPDYLPILKKLCAHPSAVVAEHAAWAAEKLTF
jgi:epoxyqueuosine reductase